MMSTESKVVVLLVYLALFDILANRIQIVVFSNLMEYFKVQSDKL